MTANATSLALKIELGLDAHIVIGIQWHNITTIEYFKACWIINDLLKAK